MKLYDYELSGNCYKVRLMLSILGVEYTKIPIDFYPGFQHKTPEFLEKNPLGQLPLIDDDGFVLRDAQAILVYLAAKFDLHKTWYPCADPALLGEISQWLAFSDAVTATASAARLHAGLFFDLDVDAARSGAHKLFRVMDQHLWLREQDQKTWLCSADCPTIADIACFPYVMLSEEGGISRQEYPAIRRWCDNFKRQDNFEVMSGIFPAGPAQDAFLSDE